MVEKGRERRGEGEESAAEPTYPAIRYFTVFGVRVHPLSARFEREIHIYVNEKEAGRGGAGKVVMRHRRPPSLSRTHIQICSFRFRVAGRVVIG